MTYRTHTQILEEAERTLALLRTIDTELREHRNARKVHRDTWAQLVTQAVMLSAAITTHHALNDALQSVAAERMHPDELDALIRFSEAQKESDRG